jgi:hypothetical protein
MKDPKFKKGQKVMVESLVCTIISNPDYNDDDGFFTYICEPVDPSKMIIGQWELGPGVIFENEITLIKGVNNG